MIGVTYNQGRCPVRTTSALLLAVLLGAAVGISFAVGSADAAKHSAEAAVAEISSVPSVPSPLLSTVSAGGECPGPHLERNVCYIRVNFQGSSRSRVGRKLTIRGETA